MIDIHSHILPARDDGAATLDDAIEMAKQAVNGGTRVLFATPHVATPRDLELAGEIAGQLHELQQELTRLEIPLRLVAGAEVDPMIGITRALDDGAPLFLGPSGKFLLLDSAFTMLPRGLEETIYQLQLRHIAVILAHPERIFPIQENPQLLEGMVHRGVLLQITSSSILGKNGPAAEQTARHLLRLRWAHFVASDAHSPVTRHPSMEEAARELLQMVDAETATALLEENGRRVLEGEPVPTDPAPYAPEKKRGGFLGLFRR